MRSASAPPDHIFQGLSGQIALQVFQGQADAVFPGDRQAQAARHMGGQQQVGHIPQGAVLRQGLRRGRCV